MTKLSMLCTALVVAMAATMVKGQCTDEFYHFYPGHIDGGGNPEASATTFNECELLCFDAPICWGFNYVTALINAIPCNLFTTQQSTAEPYDLGDTYGDAIRRCYTPPPVCSHSYWVMFPETEVAGASAPTVAPTPRECVQLCENTANCDALNWNKDNQECSLFTSGSADPTSTSGSAVSFTHFRRCDAAGASGGGGSVPTPPPGGPAPPPSGCGTDFYVFYKDHLWFGANQVTGPTTEAACVADCNTQGASCYAVDWNFDDSTCWKHDTVTILDPPAPWPQRNHYRRPCDGLPECSPDDSWYLYQGTHVAGTTTPGTGITTRSECEDACEAHGNCVAINFITTGTVCEMFASGFAPAPPTTPNNAGSVHMRKCNAPLTDPGPTPAPPTTPAPSENQCNRAYYIVFMDSLVYGGTEMVGLTTRRACMDGCLADATCFAFDYNSALNKCYKQADHYVTGNPASFPGTEHYRFLCDATQSCDGTYWELYVGLMIGGGTANAATTEALCLSACESLSGCVSFDFVGTTCTHFTTPTAPPTVSDGSALHYRKCDAGPTPPPEPTIPIGDQCDYAYMIQYDNSLSYGGTELLPPVASAMECLAACEALTSADGCYAMDYDFTTQSCFKHASAFLTGDPGLFAQRSHWRYPCDAALTCDNTKWEVYVGKVKGGTQAQARSSSTTLALCKSACESDPDCVAFDFITTPACAHFIITSSVPTTAEAAGVHYRRCDADVFPTMRPSVFVGPTGVLPNWQAYPDVQIAGGTGVEDPSSPGDLRNDMTFEQCQTECDGLTVHPISGEAAQCYSLDYHLDFGSCHLHLTVEQNCGTLIPTPSVYHVKKTGCATPGYENPSYIGQTP